MKEIIHKINDFNIIEYEKSNIFIIENIFDMIFCDKLKQLIDGLPLSKSVINNFNNVECSYVSINSLMKMDDKLFNSFIKDPNNASTKSNEITIEKIKLYNDEINCCMVKIENIMNKINRNIEFQYNSGYLLRKIYGKTKSHIDNIYKIYDSNINFIKDDKKNDYRMIRNASIIFALNDDYDGGMFNFPYYDISLKLKKGSVIIFPPYWTHEHEVYTVENDTYRYTLSTWSCMEI